jgi:hypothetical protein
MELQHCSHLEAMLLIASSGQLWCYALVRGVLVDGKLQGSGCWKSRRGNLEVEIALCPKWKVGSLGGPSYTEQDLSESTSRIVPNKVSGQTGWTGHVMQTSELLDNA